MTVIDNDDIRMSYTTKGGFVFLHLEVHNWSLSAYKAIKQSVKEVRETLAKQGHELVFATTADEKITKLWSRAHPLYQLDKYGPGGNEWIGAWETKDE